MDLIEGGTIKNLKGTLDDFLSAGEEEFKSQGEMDSEFKKIMDIVDIRKQVLQSNLQQIKD